MIWIKIVFCVCIENDTISVSEKPFIDEGVWGQSTFSFPSFLPDYRITYFARSTPIIGGIGWDVGKTYMVGGNKGEGYDAIHGGSQQEFKNQEVLEAHPKAKPMHCFKNGTKVRTTHHF
ncbi:MAG: hypothetical protein OIF50_01710 [Flavobacteriaceae bacterium]|nr:hypothetical protein [Flavobacteriaceae bacterium]